MLAPLLLLMAVFTYYPIWMSFDLSFRSWDFMPDDRPFVGLQNYRMFLSSHEFWNSVRVTLIFVVISVPLRLALAIAIAVYLLREDKVTRILRRVFFLPTVTSSVAIAVIFRGSSRPMSAWRMRYLAPSAFPRSTGCRNRRLRCSC